MAVWDAGLSQVRQLWANLSIAQRIVFVAVAAGLALGFAALVTWVGTPDYAVLYAQLEPEDAAQVVERLRTDGVPYQIEGGGRTILVPATQVYDLRLTMAAAGLPEGGVVGFEIFDETGFGMTDFAQKVNYSRALEGELTRTIRRIDGVRGARVHLVLPERRLFEQEAEPATASVVLQVAANKRLTSKQIQGVVFLVASSVRALTPDHVTVVDQAGNILYQASGEESQMLAASQLEFKRAFERETERKVRQMLEQVLGAGAAVVQVAAEFDFDKVEETAESYDPDAVAVRSEERVTESSTGAGGPSGVPGVASNLGEGQQEVAAAVGTSNRETETVNYEISKRITRTERSPGTVRRVSVAVVVDGSYEASEDGGPREFVPRSAEEMAQIRSLVERAAGVDPDRGDAVEVTSIPFQPREVPLEAGVIWEPDLIESLVKYGLAAVAGLVLLLVVVRPMMRWITGAGAEPEISEPVTVAEMERQLGGRGGAGGMSEADIDEAPPSETVKREALKKRIRELVQKEPEIAAHLIRSWMAED